MEKAHKTPICDGSACVAACATIFVKKRMRLTHALYAIWHALCACAKLPGKSTRLEASLIRSEGCVFKSGRGHQFKRLMIIYEMLDNFFINLENIEIYFIVL